MSSDSSIVSGERPVLKHCTSSEFFSAGDPMPPKPSLETRMSAGLVSPGMSMDHIDNVLNDESESDDDLMYDVLPSFQMYNTLHRNIPSGNINPDVQELPPAYEPETIEPVRSQVVEDDLEGNVVVDKVYTLPKMATPIEIDMHITQSAVKPNRNLMDESILREYTMGDVIHGYVIVENKSPQPIPFEMFYVTLEGYTCVVDKVSHRKTIKRFLRQVDFSASWSYGVIGTASGLHYNAGELDHENCVFGLRNDRLLVPGEKYKKFFTFRFPSQLLDCTCRHEKHVSIPPSFRLDRYKGRGKFSGIKPNPMLGYGHLGTKGSPILTEDFAGDEISISYTVDVRIVGKDFRNNGRKLCVLKEREYCIRFVPFGCEQAIKCTENQLEELSAQLEERFKTLEKFVAKFETGAPLSIRDTQHTAPKQVIADLQRKRSIKPKPKPKKATMYDDDHVVSCHAPYSVSQKKKKLFGGSTITHSNKTGVITLRAVIPELPMSYYAPSLLRKSNEVDKIRNKKNAANLERLKEEAHGSVDSISVHLECVPSVGSAAHSPPVVAGVTVELVALTYSSTNSVPLTMDPLFLSNTVLMKQVKSDFEEQQRRMDALKERFDEEKINAAMIDGKVRFEDFLNSQMQNDIEALQFINVRKDVVPNAFKKVTSLGKEWVQDENTWVKALDLDLSWGKTLTSNVVPSFQSCLVGRCYTLRVKVKFEHVEDDAVLEIPISVGRT